MQVCLDLIAVKPMNIIALVDEESRFPKVRPSGCNALCFAAQQWL